jgi:hypothetical protein
MPVHKNLEHAVRTSYANLMAIPGTYGGLVEMVAFSQEFAAKIYLLCTDGNSKSTKLLYMPANPLSDEYDVQWLHETHGTDDDDEAVFIKHVGVRCSDSVEQTAKGWHFERIRIPNAKEKTDFLERVHADPDHSHVLPTYTRERNEGKGDCLFYALLGERKNALPRRRRRTDPSPGSVDALRSELAGHIGRTPHFAPLWLLRGGITEALESLDPSIKKSLAASARVREKDLDRYYTDQHNQGKVAPAAGAVPPIASERPARKARTKTRTKGQNRKSRR